MERFIVHTGRVAALPRANVDTDQIIPKQFLKRIERTGFGPSLFFDWRYRADGSPDPALELNQPAARRASTRRGRWPTTVFAPSSPRRSPTSSMETAARTDCCP